MYYLLNINGDGENIVDYWIDERKIAPIFYGENTIDDILNNNCHNPPLQPQAYADAHLFVMTFYHGINSEDIVFSIGDENIYFFQQNSDLSVNGRYQHKVHNGTVKGFPIKILKTVKVKECPLVLVTIKSNRFLAAGTFRKLDKESYDGICTAIKYILSGNIQKITTFDKYLQCLSSIEFETLIAKIFEERGYFVPAYKGGVIRNFDLFCKKDGKTISIQIKLQMKNTNYNNFADLFYCINSEIERKNIRLVREPIIAVIQSY